MPLKGSKKRGVEERPPSSDSSNNGSSGSEGEGGSGSGSGSESGSEDGEHVETLVAGRAKRATAGNRLSTLLDREADDELELLFAEDEEDVEFEGKEDEDEGDERFESSSEDDDEAQGDGEGDAVLEGEQQLQREARAARQITKRKAENAMFKVPTLRRKVKKVEPKVEPTEEQSTDPKTPAQQTKSRAERVAWPASSAEGATRASMRTATMQNKEEVQARLREHEERRVKQVAVMEKAAKKRAGKVTKVMTQEERLEEARKVERLNSKSLNRWEATEKKRAEDEKARLKALQNRKLEGEVVTWYSGRAEWVDGKIKQVGRKRNADEDGKGENEKGESSEQMKGQKYAKIVELPATPQEQPTEPKRESAIPTLSDGHVPQESQSDETGFLDGIHYYASLPSQSQETPLSNGPADAASAPGTSQAQEPKNTDHDPAAATIPSSNALRTISPLPELSTRNLVILQNFDSHGLRPDREFPGSMLVKKKTVKPQSTSRSLYPQIYFRVCISLISHALPSSIQPLPFSSMHNSPSH